MAFSTTSTTISLEDVDFLFKSAGRSHPHHDFWWQLCNSDAALDA